MHALSDINLSYWFFQTIAMLITAFLIPGLRVTSLFGALLTVVALAFVNSKVWDTALFFKIPDTFSMQAGLLLMANGLLFWILVKILPGIEIDGFLPAIAAPVIFTIFSLVIESTGVRVDWPAVIKWLLDKVAAARAYFEHVGNTAISK